MTSLSSDPKADLREENARLARELSEALQQQTATAEVLQIINSSPGDLAPVFGAILEKAMRLCEAPIGVLWTYHVEYVCAEASRGAPPAYAEYLEQGQHRPSRAQQSLLSGQRFVQVVDIIASEGYRSGDPVSRAAADLGGVRTLLIVPLLKDGAPIGQFSIYRQEVRPFSDKQIALLQKFADQAVVAISNARLFNETQETLAQQTATAEVLGVINSSPGDLQVVFEAMVEKARRLCDAASGHLALPLGDDFRTAAVSAMSPDLETIIRSVSYAPGRGTAIGRCLLERRAVQIADIAADSEHAARHVAHGNLIRTILGVPLLREGEPIGAFGLSRARVEPFTERQIEL
ncbi:MAG TPA: GAF domain-containing protein, partial [Bradyrhizobium sp.]|nr:GAF domain-containing protein [Bradyrhizobium sp.]